MKNILNKILENKKKRINIYKKENPENKIINNIKNVKNFIDFKDKLKKSDSNKKISIIAEIKKASPSAGVLVENFNHLNIARLYVENGASFLSVLTEEDFFQGKMEFIQNIKENFKIPVLCKDFFIDTYQVLQAKSYGADCILIILSAVDKMLAKDLYQTAKELNISTLVEVHSKNEAEIALSFEDSLIGINNRNLQTLEISLNTSIELSKILSSHKNPIICESGINTTENIKFIVKNAKIYSFLIGESLLKSDNIGTKLKEFAEITL
tara:strand:+ start:1067 stop:1870 length:804 start_codon:yes stop_codon:yes gene_type:complete